MNKLITAIETSFLNSLVNIFIGENIKTIKNRKYKPVEYKGFEEDRKNLQSDFKIIIKDFNKAYENYKNNKILNKFSNKKNKQKEHSK